MNARLIACSEIAKTLGVKTSTVRRWVKFKLLTPTVVTPGGHLRFDEAEFERLRATFLSGGAPAVIEDKPIETKIEYFLENYATTHSHLVWRPVSKTTKQREIWLKESPAFASAEAERLAAQQKSDDDTLRMITGRSLKELRDEIVSTSLDSVADSLNVPTDYLRRLCEAFHIVPPLPKPPLAKPKMTRRRRPRVPI